MAGILELPKYNEKILEDLTAYTKTSPYKSTLKLIDPSGEGLEATYNKIKGECEGLKNKGVPTKISNKDRYKYAFAFSFQRDFITRYASRKALIKAAIDRKMWYNAVISSNFEAMK